MALSVLLFSKAVDFSLREVLIRQFGLAATDLWQAVAKLSDNYTMVFSALMSSVYYPRLAALSAQPRRAGRGFVRLVLRLLAPMLAVGLGSLWLAAPGCCRCCSNPASPPPASCWAPSCWPTGPSF